MNRSPDAKRDAAQSLVWPLRVAAAASWRMLLVLAALGVLFWLLNYLAAVTIPIGIALLMSALFAPLVRQLVRWHVPRSLATAIAIVVGLSVIAGVISLVATTVSASLPQLEQQATTSFSKIDDWLHNGPAHLSDNDIRRWLTAAVDAVKGSTAELAGRTLSTAAAVLTTVADALLALFTLIFFLFHGPRIWQFALRIVPAGSRDRIDLAGRRGFASLVSYVRATVAVAVVDAVCIGVGLWLVGVPLPVPLAGLIFIGAFVPIIGAFVTGALAVPMALVAKGILAAALVLAILVAVMQLESHVLQPFLLGRAARLHPLAVVLAIAVGVEVAGIVGALLAVPLLAVSKAAIGSLLHDRDPLPETVDALRPANARPDRTPAE